MITNNAVYPAAKGKGVLFFKRVLGILAVFLLLLNFGCGRNQTDEESVAAPKSPRKAVFAELFNFESSITIQGTSMAPLFAAWRPLITNDRIYVSDYMGHAVYVYNKQGELLRKLGGKGSGPGEFKMPYGVAVDVSGNLFVNDRQNFRVQVFDSRNNFDYVTDIKIPGHNETLFLRNSTEKPNIVMVGRFLGEDRKNCIIQERDWASMIIRSYACLEDYFVLGSWAAAQDSDGTIYLINQADTQIRVFDESGRQVATWNLNSPSMLPLNTEGIQKPKTRTELTSQFKMLKETVYTSIQEIFVFGDFIVVFLRLENTESDDKFYLDFYDKSGNLVYYGLKTPGWLQCVTDKFYFTKLYEENEYGALEIQEYSFHR